MPMSQAEPSAVSFCLRADLVRPAIGAMPRIGPPGAACPARRLAPRSAAERLRGGWNQRGAARFVTRAAMYHASPRPRHFRWIGKDAIGL